MIETMCRKAREASRLLALVPTQQKNDCLLAMAEIIWGQRDAILKVNQSDVQVAEKKGLSPAMIDRLMLDEKRLEGIASSLRDVVSLPDPVGIEFDVKDLPNGLHLLKKRVPIGVIAVIYESRPNVTIEVASLALKTGNAIILRGGSETIGTNRAFVAAIRTAMQQTGLPVEAVQFIDSPDRSLVNELLKMHDTVGMLIPRGGSQLHQFCRENSTIPVITGGIGICHLFVDETADQDASLKVVENAKIQRPSVCNALDTVLVHRKIAAAFLPRLVNLLKSDGVTFRAHENAMPYLGNFTAPLVQPAGPEDFDIEWLSLVLGVKVVDGLDEAVEHIAAHSTGHSDGILTGNSDNANRFIACVDSAAVYVNASTRYTDGGQFGLGAEVAVSTQRLHARGPMALEELTTYKWVARGNYSVRP
jgi:glutamate-5-semialdehyde dehydrogenase